MRFENLRFKYSEEITAPNAKIKDMTTSRSPASSPSVDCIAVNKASGKVRVSPGIFETNVIVAPNSPKLLANVKIEPVISPGIIIGKVIDIKTHQFGAQLWQDHFGATQPCLDHYLCWSLW